MAEITKTFVFEPKLGDLAKELKEKIVSGELTYQDALAIMKQAITDAIKEKGYPIRDDSIN